MLFTYFNNDQELKDFQQAKADFIRLLKNKQLYYESTANKDTVSRRMIEARNTELKVLANFHNQTLRYLAAQVEALKLADDLLLKCKEYSKCLEAVCLLHGINDFPLYTARKFPSLLAELKSMYAENAVHVPRRLKPLFDERYSND